MQHDTASTVSSWSPQRQLLEAVDLSAVLDRAVDCATALAQGIDAVTIALADSQHELRNLKADRRDTHSRAGILFVDTMHALAPLLTGTRASFFGPYARSDHQLLFPGHEDLKVVGIAPLLRRGRLIGSINIAGKAPETLDAIRASGELDRLRIMVALALENAIAELRLRRSGIVDPLTGWYNQQYLQRRLQEEVSRSERERQALACMVVDIDNFRDFNVRFGSDVGDEVLREVAHRIEAVMRRSDIAVRCGGEEFALLLPNTEEQQGRPLVERIHRALAATPFDVRGAEPVAVSVSIGVAAHQPGRGSIDPRLAGSELLARAQLALYESQARRRRGAPDVRVE